MNQPDEVGRTPLHNASWGCEGGREGIKTSTNGRDSPECVQALIDRGASTMARDAEGNTPLHSASNTNAPESLQLMLQRGGDVDVLSNFGSTPLHKCCKFGTVECAKVLLRFSSCLVKVGAKLDVKDKRGFEAVDYLMINGLSEAFKYFLVQQEFPALKEYVRKHLVSLRALYMCIDNDSEECLELLLNRFESEFSKEVLKDWMCLVRRCLLVNSNKCLKVMLKLKDLEMSPVELELAVYFADKEIVHDMIRRYYDKNNKLEENVIKACIYKKNIDYIEMLLSITKSCAKESEEWIAESGTIDYSTDQIYNLDYLKGRKQYTAVPFKKLHQDFSDNNILQYAIERKEEKIALALLQTNVNLRTRRRTDGATCLVLATKVACVEVLERTAFGGGGDNEQVQGYGKEL